MLAELGPNFRYRFDDTIKKVKYSIIDYEVDGKLTRVWLDGWTGYPRQIDYHPDLNSDSKPTKTLLFDDMIVGGFSEKDVTPKI